MAIIVRYFIYFYIIERIFRGCPYCRNCHSVNYSGLCLYPFQPIPLPSPLSTPLSGKHYFNCGSTIPACFDPGRDNDDFDLPPNPDHIYFSVKNLNLIFRRAQLLRATILDEIGTRPWGERSFYMEYPFGNKICFLQEETVFDGE